MCRRHRYNFLFCKTLLRNAVRCISFTPYLTLMKFSIEHKEKCSVLRLEEEKLDASISPELKTEFVNLISREVRNIILDLGRVKYADSSGLSSILTANRLCDEKGGMFALAALNDHVLKLIKISQLDTVLNLVPTVEEAVDAVFLHEIESEMRSEEGDK